MKKQKSNSDFLKFQQVFKKYQQLFGLTGYRVYFKHEPLCDAYATITVNQEDHIATVSLNSTTPEEELKFRDVEASAKHEAIHLLTGRLQYLASSRYCNEDEIYQEVENLAFKLESLIP